MTWLKDNWFKIAILLLVIVCGAFAWYALRPAIAARKCDAEAIDRVSPLHGDRIDYEYFYRRCLRQWGIPAPITDKLLG